MNRSILALLVALPLASAAVAADAAAPATPPPSPNGIFGSGILTGWDNSADLGLSGTSGNTESTTFHMCFNTAKSDADTATKAVLTYDYSITESVKSQNRFVAEGTRSWFFEKDSNWAAFGNLRFENNEFNTFRNQVTGAVGPSYRFIDDKEFTLVGRAGPGFHYVDTNTTAAPISYNGTVSAELQFGADFTWKIDARQALTIGTTFYTSIAGEHADVPYDGYTWKEDFGKHWRNVTTAAYTLAIDSNKALKVAVEYDYDDTQIAPREKGDFKYWVALTFKL